MRLHVQTLSIVALVTLLIWVFAEGESLSSGSVTVQVRLVSDVANLAISTDDPGWDGTCKISLDGPTARLDEMRALLRQPEAIELTSRELGTESGTIRLSDALRRHPIFQRRGVSIVSTIPQSVTIVVDRLVERTATLAVDPDGIPVRGRPQADPASVVVHIPLRVVDDLPDPLTLDVRLSAEMVRGLTPGEAQTIVGVPVEVPKELEGIREYLGAMPRVSVSLTLLSLSETRTIASVPVDVRIPGVVSDRYRVRIGDQQQLLAGIELRGPVDDLDQIGPGKRYTPRIDVFLTPEDLATKVPSDGSEGELVLRGELIGVPAGVEVTQAIPTIHVFVRRLEADEASPGGGLP